MLINDYSQQNWTSDSQPIKVSITEILTAGIIFILPVIFLLVITAS